MDNDPLQLLPEEQWLQLEPSLKLDWPRSILIISLLDTLQKLPELRRKLDLKIYCPYGDVTIGVVTTCMKKSSHEVFVHCNRDVKTFLEAIKGSKVINWDLVAVQFTDRHVMESMAHTMRSRGVEWCHLLSSDTIYFDRNIFEIQLPQEIKFGLLSKKHIAQVNSMWEYRYPGSEWYFEQLIDSKLGYGLFEKESNNLVAWMFYTESGTYENFHVLDAYRRKGFGELLVKIAHNIVRKNREYVYTFCVKGNSAALAMFEKIGVKVIGETFWAIFMSKTRSKI